MHVSATDLSSELLLPAGPVAARAPAAAAAGFPRPHGAAHGEERATTLKELLAIVDHKRGL